MALIVLLAVSVAVLVLSATPAFAASAETIAEVGERAGQVNEPQAVAVDNATGLVFAGEDSGHRVDEFDPSKPASERFILAFGFGVRTGAEELQVCTTATTCFTGQQGSGPGEIRPSSLAVDESTGDVYAYDFERERVEKYTQQGELLLIIGKEVDKTTKANLCTVASGDTCGAGVAGSGPGAFSASRAPLSVDSSGHLWVGETERLEQFNSQGEFISEVKLPGAGQTSALAVDADPSSPSFKDFYTLKPPTAGTDEVQRIVFPSGTPTFTLTFGGQTTRPITHDSETDEGTIGEALEALPGVGHGNVEVRCSGECDVRFTHALGDLDVEQMTANGPVTVVTYAQGKPEVPGVLTKRNPSGEQLESLDALGSPRAIGFDPATGDLFVSDQRDEGVATLLEFAPTGELSEVFGTGEVANEPVGNALAFGDGAARLYVAGKQVLQSLALPEPGPLFTEGSARATEVGKTIATLNATVNPEGAATSYHFQYITEADFVADGDSFGAGALETLSASLPGDFEAHPVATPVSGLAPGVAYRFRLVSSNSNAPLGVDGETAAFQTLPAAAIDSVSVSDVASSSATLEAEINPLGDATSYRFEYLSEAEYQADGETFSGPDAPTAVPVPDGALGAGSLDVTVSQHIGSLAPGTVYRYRVLAHNVVSEEHGGPVAGPTRAFTTQRGASSTALPDGREWEMVSPPDKHSGQLSGIGESHLIQAAGDGGALTLVSEAPTEASPEGYADEVQLLAARGEAGASSPWVSRVIAPPHGGVATGLHQPTEYRFFSSDLSLGAVAPLGAFDPAISPAASGRTVFLRSNFPAGYPAEFCGAACYEPLVTGCPAEPEPCAPAVEELADIPPGVIAASVEFQGATPDLSHVLLGSGTALTATPLQSAAAALYEYAAANPPSERLRLISELPDGSIPHDVVLGQRGGGVARHAISSDGSRVIFTSGSDHLYLRYNATAEPSAISAGQCTEPLKACTIELDALHGGPLNQEPHAEFQDASVDGSKVFFSDSEPLTANAGTNDLYLCEIVTEASGVEHCDLSDLTPAGSGGIGGVAFGASEDGSYFYYVDGADHLKLWHEGATTTIATLSGADTGDFGKASNFNLNYLTARVSPDGRWVAFVSQNSLTGYDNRDASNGRPAEEVFLYHAAAGAGGEGRLICASCNPTGARPHAVERDKLGYGIGFVGPLTFWPATQMLAAYLPPWTKAAGDPSALYQSRYLSDSGRLFFNSSDALVPSDVNGTGDVYEFEPPQGSEGVPASDNCTSSSSTYSSTDGGCVSLISSGTSNEEAGFLDASETGDDVFFLTPAELSARDTDTLYDAYDAHACSASSPCPPPPPPPPPACEGDACQTPTSAPNDPTPDSLTYRGPGNLTPPSPPVAKPKTAAQLRAAKLAKALKACRRVKPGRRRASCERAARKRYGAKAKKAERASNDRRAKR